MRDLTRRTILRGAATTAVAGGATLALAACGEEKVALCADPDKMTSGEASLRAAANYVEKSPDQTKTCRNCAFFTATRDSTCGTCQIFNNGPANPNGHCISWSAKT